MSRPSGNQSVVSTGRTLRLARKELREILRDRRTVLTLVLMPLLVYPLLGVIMRKGVLSNLSLLSTVEIHVCVEDDRQAAIFSAAMMEGGNLLKVSENLARSEQVGGNPADEGPGILKSGGEQPFEFLVYTLDEDDDQQTLRRQIEQSFADIAVEIRPAGTVPPAPEGLNAGPFFDWVVLRRDSSSLSERGFREINRRLKAYNDRYNKALLNTVGLSDQKPVEVSSEVITSDGDGVSPLVTFIPLVLVLMTMTGAVYPAIDLTAGERERGTMEILVSAPMSRMTLLAGKFVAVLTVAVLTASMNLISMFATLFALGLEGTVLGNVGPTMVFQVIVLMVVFAAFFSAVLLSITSIARSFKEAQAYLIPLMLMSLTPGVFSLMPDLKMNSLLAVTPLVNTVLMGRDLLQGEVDVLMFAVVLISTALYGVLALSLAARIFGSDAVLYSNGGTWAELFKRPEERISVAPMPLAMSCLAVVFSVFIIAQAIPSKLDISMQVQFLVSGIISIAMFVGIPVLAAGFGRVAWSSGFAIRKPDVLMWIAAAFLGLSLWPFIYEIELTILSADRVKELASLREGLKNSLDAVPLWVKLFSLAVAPAACEEFFFRGFLQNAIRQRSTAWVSILAAGTLFGLFHVIVRDALLYERLIPSTLMGIILGYVFERSGSVLPGILLHVLHNGLLIIVSEYEAWLMSHGIGVSNDQHLPLSVFGIAAVPIVCATWILVFKKRPTAESSPQAETI